MKYLKYCAAVFAGTVCLQAHAQTIRSYPSEYASGEAEVAVHIVENVVGLRFNQIPSDETIVVTSEALRGVGIDGQLDDERQSLRANWIVFFGTNEAQGAVTHRYINDVRAELDNVNVGLATENRAERVLYVGQVLWRDADPDAWMLLNDRLVVRFRDDFGVDDLLEETIARDAPVGEANAPIDAEPGTSLRSWVEAVPSPLSSRAGPGRRAVLRVSPESPFSALELANRIHRLEITDYATPDFFSLMEKRSYFPKDQYFDFQWPLHNTGSYPDPPGGQLEADADIDAPEAWEITRGAADIVVAVLDDGVEGDHPDLAANIVPNPQMLRRNFTGTGLEHDTNPQINGDAHGTEVAGVVAASMDNDTSENGCDPHCEGIAGICPQCRILPIRVVYASDLSVAEGVAQASNEDADVIVAAFGIKRLDDNGVLREVVEEAVAEGRGGLGIPIFWAMPNVDDTEVPCTVGTSSLANVIKVGLSDSNDKLQTVAGSWNFKTGGCIDLVASSWVEDADTTMSVWSTDIECEPGSDSWEQCSETQQEFRGNAQTAYVPWFGGTSGATALAGGTAGLMLSLDPELTWRRVWATLAATAEKIDDGVTGYYPRNLEGFNLSVLFSDHAGFGRINAARALEAVCEPPWPHAQLMSGACIRIPRAPTDLNPN